MSMVGLCTPPFFDPETTAVFLDLDGTLTPIVARPDGVVPDGALTALVHRLGARLDGRLAVLSGRTLVEIDRILEAAAPAAAGVHGLERRTAGSAIFAQPAHPAVDGAAAALDRFAEAHPGVLVERKPQSVALHYRALPQAAAAALTLAEQLAGETGLTLQRGSMVAELRTPGGDKGQALRAFMTETPFAGAAPIMVGDDLTDEAAFAAAKSLGGFGVLVGAPRETAAAYRLNGVDDVRAWLARIADAPRARQVA